MCLWCVLWGGVSCSECCLLRSVCYGCSRLCTLYTIHVEFNFHKYLTNDALHQHFYTMSTNPDFRRSFLRLFFTSNTWGNTMIYLPAVFWHRHGSHECSPLSKSFQFPHLFPRSPEYLPHLPLVSHQDYLQLIKTVMKEITSTWYYILCFQAKWCVPVLKSCYGITNFLAIPICLYTAAVIVMGL